MDFIGPFFFLYRTIAPSRMRRFFSIIFCAGWFPNKSVLHKISSCKQHISKQQLRSPFQTFRATFAPFAPPRLPFSAFSGHKYRNSPTLSSREVFFRRLATISIHSSLRDSRFCLLRTQTRLLTCSQRLRSLFQTSRATFAAISPRRQPFLPSQDSTCYFI